jgi:hypothetical protein
LLFEVLTGPNFSRAAGSLNFVSLGKEIGEQAILTKESTGEKFQSFWMWVRIPCRK